MNAIQYALNQVRHEIPMQILDLAFGYNSVAPRQTTWHQPSDNQSIDATIRDRVIEGRVNLDCNLFGGTEVAIDLTTIPYESPSPELRIFRIPYDRTAGLRIVSVRHLTYMNFHGISGYVHGRGDARLTALQTLYAAASTMPIVSTANCQLMGDNVVVVRDDMMHTTNQLTLVCLVENDAGMTNINPGLFPLYSQMVSLAVKAYIYINLDIQMDRGYLVGGMNLGRIREVVDSYSDANEMYSEILRTRWQRASFTNDRPRMNSFIKSMIGRGL